MRRLLATACVVLAVLGGTSSIPAGAADNGVGPSDSGSTGTARACEVQAQNKGGDPSAGGLECAGLARLTGTFSVYSEGGYTNACWLEASGSGLQPGTLVWIVTPAFGRAFLGRASSTGEWSFSYFSAYSCKELHPAYLEGTAASGDPITSPIIRTVG